MSLKQTYMYTYNPEEKFLANITTYAHDLKISIYCPNDNIKKKKWKAIIKECMLPIYMVWHY